jgi:energy-coupling factor transport system substrate-specific component
MTQPGSMRWRTVDIVVASVLGVAFGVVFWAWGQLWVGPADAIPLPGRAIIYGVWLLPAVLGALVIRKPGAAIYTEMIAAVVSMAIGTAWGWTVAVEGLVEAAAAELAFAILAYRVFNLAVALLSGALSGFAAGLFDAIAFYPGESWTRFEIPYIAIVTVSSIVIAGLGAWALTRALAQTGALDRFPSGRERAAV